MRTIAMAAVVASMVTAAVQAQNWQFYNPLRERVPNVEFLVIDPNEPLNSAASYKRVTLEDLLRGLVRFPDSLTRYVAVKATDDFTQAELTGGAMVTGFATGVRIPALTTSDTGYIAVSVPRENTNWSGWWTDGSDQANPGAPSTYGYRLQPDLSFTLGEGDDAVVYDVWMNWYAWETYDWQAQAVYFDAGAVPPTAIPTLYMDGAGTLEGDDLVFSARLIGGAPRTENVFFSYATSNGDTHNLATGAIAGTDYTATSGVLTFAPGENHKTITVPTTEDTRVEVDEGVKMNMSRASGVRLVGEYGRDYGKTAPAMILDDDTASSLPRPTLAVEDVTAAEGSTMTFTVTANKGFGNITSQGQSFPRVVLVEPVFDDGTATLGEDYTATTPELLFGGDHGLTQTFTVELLQDEDDESDETFTVGIKRTGYYQGFLSSDTATGTITDDD